MWVLYLEIMKCEQQVGWRLKHYSGFSVIFILYTLCGVNRGNLSLLAWKEDVSSCVLFSSQR